MRRGEARTLVLLHISVVRSVRGQRVRASFTNHAEIDRENILHVEG
jgi:hypothetical protein